MLILRFGLQWACLFLLVDSISTADSNGNGRQKKLNQAEIANMLQNLARDSSTALNGSKVLGYTKPEKNEALEDDLSDHSNMDSHSSDQSGRALGTTTALESGETYLTGEPIRIKIEDNGSHEDNSSFVYYSIKPEDDDWLRNKVEEIKNLNI